MINDYYETAVRDDPTLEWSDLEMFQKDLKGAFTLLFFDADGVQHLAMEMTDEKVIIFTCGIFSDGQGLRLLFKSSIAQ
jgi:predicted nuclease of predicted toxin-antitoxin system